MPDKKKKSFFRRFVTHAERLVAVDIGSRVVKIAVIQQRKDEHVIAVCDAMPLPYASSRGDISAAQINDTLQRLLARNGLTSGAFITLLPGGFATIRQCDVPSTSEEQIAQIVPFEAEKYVPYSLDRAVMDFAFDVLEGAPTTPEDIAAPAAEARTAQEAAAQETANALAAKGSKSRVTIVAARLAGIKKLLDLLTLKNFKHYAIDVSSVAGYNAYLFATQAQPSEETGATALIDIGARWTDITLVDNESRRFLYTRSGDCGGDLFTSALAKKESLTFEEAEKLKCQHWDETTFAQEPSFFTETAAPLISYIERTFSHITSHGIASHISRIVLTGGVAAMPEVATLFSKTFSCPVDIGNPFTPFNVTPKESIPAIFMHVIGAALRITQKLRLSIDLLPVDVTRLQEQALRRKRLQRVAVVAAFIVGVALTAFGANVAYTRYQRTAIASDIQRLSPQVSRANVLRERNERMRRAVTGMRDLTDRKTSWSQVLLTIADAMHSNVWVRALTVNNRNQLTLQGTSIGTAYIHFRTEMEKIPRFSNVEIGQTSRREISGVVCNDFTLTCDVLPDYRYEEHLEQVKERLRQLLRESPQETDTSSEEENGSSETTASSPPRGDAE